jgi:glutathione S-transferase
MLTVHHLNDSRSQRILWLLEELDVEYEIERYERNPETMLAPRELRDVHPLGKSPVITHEGRTIAESGAIIEYIVDEFDDGSLRPDPDTDAYRRYRYWMHYAEGSAMPQFLLKLVFGRLPDEVPFLVRPVAKLISKGVTSQYIDPQIARHMDFWEAELGERDYFAGDAFTAADIQMSFPLEAAMVRSPDMAEYPRITGLVERLRDRPAYERAIERGGSFSLDM